MVITDALWQVVTSIEDGKDPARYFIQPFLLPSSFVTNSPKRGIFKFSVISMVIAGGKTFSCMAVTCLINQKTHVYSPSSCPKSAHSSFTTSPDSETKNLKNQLLEWPFSTNLSVQQFTLLRAHFAVMIWDPTRIITLVRII